MDTNGKTQPVIAYNRRTALEPFDGRRITVTGYHTDYDVWTEHDRYRNYPVACIQNPMVDGKTVAQHVWIHHAHPLKELHLKRYAKVECTAVVRQYKKTRNGTTVYDYCLDWPEDVTVLSAGPAEEKPAPAPVTVTEEKPPAPEVEPVTEEKPDKPDEHDPDPINKADWIREVHQDNPGLNAGDLHKLLKDEYGLDVSYNYVAVALRTLRASGNNEEIAAFSGLLVHFFPTLLDNRRHLRRHRPPPQPLPQS